MDGGFRYEHQRCRINLCYGDQIVCEETVINDLQKSLKDHKHNGGNNCRKMRDHGGSGKCAEKLFVDCTTIFSCRLIFVF